MRKRVILLFVLGCLCWPGVGLFSQQKEKVLQAVRCPKGEIRVDGILNERVWGLASIASDFVQRDPDEGKPATEKTTVQVAYDDHAIYVAVRAYDSEPDKIKGILTRRDQDSPSDWIWVAVDSYGDKRTAFEFGVNPAGVKQDACWSDDENRDENWDAVWEVGISKDGQGWTAEFCIPFSQLRFPNRRVHRWGFQVTRFISRKNELDFWAPMPKETAGVVSRFGRLEGIEDIPTPKRLQLLPYIVSSGNLFPKEVDNPFRSGPFYRGSLGGDLKYGLTSNLTLDLTINPDFGQVEADPSEFNLTAYETYFEEKRPFFMEGRNILNYPIDPGESELAKENLFYSRRIGRAPHHYPEVSDSGFVDQPQWTRILGAVKITGKTASGWSIGVLEALTREEKAKVEEGGREFRVVVEPLTNYFVARIQKDFRKGRTTLGGIITNVTRRIPNDELKELNKRAWSGGIDFSHRWRKDTYQIAVKLLGSVIKGDTLAIQKAQRSSARYFQRPDARHLHYDPRRTSLSGFAAFWQVGKIGGGHWRWVLGGLSRSPGFEVNDLGYIRDVDWTAPFIWVGYRQFNPGKVFRNWGVNLNLWSAWTYGGERVGSGGNINGYFRLLNYWGIYLGVNRQLESLDTRSLRGGPAIMTPGRINFWFGFWSDERKPISIEFHSGFSRDDEGFWRCRLEPELSLRPSGNLNLSLSLGYYPSLEDRQYVKEIEDDQGTHYIFSRLQRKTLALTTRLDYTLTPNLSIQFYGMPFISAGKYSHFKEVVNPRAQRYDDRYHPYDYTANPDFNFKQFRSNLVIRWEYSPGSTIYLVWSQGRTNFEENYGTFSLGRDLGKLFNTRAENVFLVKINRWFSL